MVKKLEKFPPAPLCILCNSRRDIDKDGDQLNYTGFWRNLCQRCRYDIYSVAWASWTEWEELLGGNLHYLNGRIDCVPYSDGPAQYEQYDMQHLWRLQAYGLLTVYCGGRDEWGPEFSAGKGWHSFRQRPWIEFLIPTLHKKIDVAAVNRLVEELLAHDEIVATAFSEYDEYPIMPRDAPQDEVAPLSQILDASAKGKEAVDKTYYFRTNVWPNHHSVMETRNASLLHEFSKCLWVGQMDFPLSTTAEVADYVTLGVEYDFKQKIRAAKKQRVLCVQIAARAWGTDLNLRALLEGVCEKAGLRRDFSVEDMQRSVVKPGQEVYS